MAYKPYLTSQDLIDSVKRRISFPAYQSTFTDNDILALANEEMSISQVPSVLEYHEGYFVYRVDVPLTSYNSRYKIPDRAIGMRLRDLVWVDQSQNFFEMTRIDDSDKTYFQRSVGENTAVGKYYIENNEIVLTPSIQAAPIGWLGFFIFLRPNQLVQNNRAATIQSFSKDIAFNNNLLSVGDQVQILRNQGAPNASAAMFTAVDTTILSTATGPVTTIQISNPHNVIAGANFTVIISENTGSTPSINGTWIATSLGIDTFTIPVATSVATTTGNVALELQYAIGSTSTNTALNFANSVNEYYSDITALNNAPNNTRITYPDITLQAMSITTDNVSSILINNALLLVNFDQLPSTWQNLDDGSTTPLYTNGSLVDFLETNPGHRTYTYNIKLLSAQGTTGTFNYSDFLRYQSTGSGTIQTILPIQVGDYICLANESIIPQIPPDMHTVLAERTSMRILQALGDAQGMQVSDAKLKQMETQQGILIDNRVDDSPRKILNRHSVLRYGITNGVRRRM